MIPRRIFSETIRIRARKSELRAESRSYGPQKSELQPGQTPKIWTESPRKSKKAPNGVEVLLQKTPLKAFLNPHKVFEFSAYTLWIHFSTDFEFI